MRQTALAAGRKKELPMADDRRKTLRKNSTLYLEVIDRVTGIALGRLVDITTLGMMLMSASPTETGKQFQTRITLPPKLRRGDFLDVDCRCTWCRVSINTDFHDAGFEFADLSDQDSLTIELLIKYYAFNG